MVVLTSPRIRARATCELAGLGGRAEVEPDLAEWNYGDYEGKTTAEIQATRPGWSLWKDGCPGGESAPEVGRRADRAIETIVAHAGEDDVVAVFSHGHFLRTFGARWLGLPPQDGRLFVIDTTHLAVMGFEHDERVFRAWNT